MELNITQTILLLLVIATASGLYIITYRLFFHPLAKYPGPLLAKLTNFYDVYHSSTGNRKIDQYKCHMRYGPIVRYGPNQIIFNDATSLRDIYSVPKSANVRKSRVYEFLQAPDGSTSLHSETDKEIHGFKRRIMGRGFSEQALKTLEPFMEQNINKWLDVLGAGATETSKGWSTAKSTAEWANYLTIDVLGDLCFGKPFHLITSDRNREIPDLLTSRATLSQFVGRSTILLALWKKVLEPYGIVKYFSPRMAQRLASFRSVAASSMKERLAVADTEKGLGEDQSRKDFVYWLLRGSDPVTGHAYPQGELANESTLLINAGANTSAITIAALVYCMTRHPNILAKLQQELRANFSGVEEIVTGPQLTKCTYLRAAIEETLRVSPPVGASLPREVTKGGITINREYFREGTIVGVNAYAIQHNEKYYPDPFHVQARALDCG